MAKKPGVLTIDDIVKMYGLPPFDKIEELNAEYISEAWNTGREEAIEEGLSAKEAEEKAMKAEQEAADEVYRNWHDAVEAAADEILGHHHLQIVPRRAGERVPYEYEVTPIRGKTWNDAAIAIANTIEGVGMFSIPAEDLRAPKKFVLSHLGHTRDYPEVYGTASASRIYERAWR